MKLRSALLALVLIVAMAAPAAAASTYDPYWSFYETHYVNVGRSGGTAEPNDLSVRTKCYDDSIFRVKIQYRAYWRWWNDEEVRYLRCRDRTTWWNPTRSPDTYRVVITKLDSGTTKAAVYAAWT